MPKRYSFRRGYIGIYLPDGDYCYFYSYVDDDPSQYVTSEYPLLLPYSLALGIARTIRSCHPDYCVEVIGVV